MAGKSVPKAATVKRNGVEKPLTKEEQTLVGMYRNISGWEQKFFFMILQSLAWGPLMPETDEMSWEEIIANSGLTGRGEGVTHG